MATLIDTLVLQHLHSRGYTEAATILKKTLEVGELLETTSKAAAQSAENRPSLLKLLAPSAQMWAHSYEEVRDWVDGSLDAYKAVVAPLTTLQPSRPNPVSHRPHGL